MVVWEMLIHHSHHPEFPHSFTPSSKPTSFTNSFYRGLSSSLRSDSSDQDHYLLSYISFRFFCSFPYFSLIGSMWQNKLAIVPASFSAHAKHFLPAAISALLNCLSPSTSNTVTLSAFRSNFKTSLFNHTYILTHCRASDPTCS